jgi:hypothetical protein
MVKYTKPPAKPVTFPTLDQIYRVKPAPERGTGGTAGALERRIKPPQPKTRKTR